jgi:UPF0755 protein
MDQKPRSGILLFFKICTASSLLFAVTLCSFYIFFLSAPSFTETIRIDIEKGQGVLSVAHELEEKGVVRSARITANIMVYLNAEKKIKAGMYLFKRPESAFRIAQKVVQGDFGYIPIKLTVPEGTNYRQLATLISEKFPYMATSTLERELKPLEGYLFPDTYFFAPEARDVDIIEKMKDTFEKKINTYIPQIQSSGRSVQEVLIFASILEEEVRTKEDRGLVADLLFRRIEKGMSLQVDATLGYVTGKGSAELRTKDLKTDNPYNTYTRKGLPPTPISNPGLDTIEAVLNPLPNEYLFYLSDKNGITHFAKTYKEHLKNKYLYLK